MNQWAKALFHKGSTPLLNYIMEWVLLATGIAGHISSVCSLPKVLFVDVRSHFVLFSLLQKPGCHIPQGLLHRARLICKAFRRSSMTELPV